MAKIPRIKQKVFASTAGASQIGKFGSLAAGSPVTTTDADVVQDLSNFEGGWNSAIVGNNSPAIQDMNGLFFLAFKQLAYLFQQGVAEWNAQTEYHIGSVVNTAAGDLYYSLTNTNLNNLVTDDTEWRPVWQKFLTVKGDIIAGDGSKAINVAVGTNKSILMADSSTSSGVAWTDAMPVTKGDIISSNGSVVTKLAVGTNGATLEADSTQASGVKWGTGSDTAIKKLSVRNWINRTCPAGVWLRAVYSPTLGKYALVGEGGTNFAASSESGLVWTVRTASENNLWQDVCWGSLDALFVAVASSGINRVMYSSNGTTWTAAAASQANPWRGVCEGNGTFVAVANSGTNRVMTSTNGISWTNSTAAAANSWYSIAYGNSIFVATSIDGTDRVMTSPTGATWTSRSCPAESWGRIGFGNGWFVAVSSTGTSFEVMRSSDGINWTGIVAPTSGPTNIGWNDIAYGNGIWVASSAAGRNDGERIMVSFDDGLTWEIINSIPDTSLGVVVYGQHGFTCLPTTAVTECYTSLRTGITVSV